MYFFYVQRFIKKEFFFLISLFTKTVAIILLKEKQKKIELKIKISYIKCFWLTNILCKTFMFNTAIHRRCIESTRSRPRFRDIWAHGSLTTSQSCVLFDGFVFLQLV